MLLAAVLAPLFRGGKALAASRRYFSALVYFGLGVCTVLSEGGAARAGSKYMSP